MNNKRTSGVLPDVRLLMGFDKYAASVIQWVNDAALRRKAYPSILSEIQFYLSLHEKIRIHEDQGGLSIPV